MSKHHRYPEEVYLDSIERSLRRVSPIEKVLIRDWRFRKHVERTASGAGHMDIDDDGKEMRIAFHPDRRSTRVGFLDKAV
jgi:hypothetical protein